MPLGRGAAARGLLRRWAPWPGVPDPDTEARKGSPPRFPATHAAERGSLPRQRLARGHPRLLPAPPGLRCQFTAPAEALPLHPVSPAPARDTGGPAAFSGSPLSHSWPQCWSLASTQNLPRPPPAVITCDPAREAVGEQQPGGRPDKSTGRPRPEGPPPPAAQIGRASCRERVSSPV